MRIWIYGCISCLFIFNDFLLCFCPCLLFHKFHSIQNVQLFNPISLDNHAAIDNRMLSYEFPCPCSSNMLLYQTQLSFSTNRNKLGHLNSGVANLHTHAYIYMRNINGSIVWISDVYLFPFILLIFLSLHNSRYYSTKCICPTISTTKRFIPYPFFPPISQYLVCFKLSFLSLWGCVCVGV